eukprot:2421184-Ditylum_brightwellii.AAC.1
MAANLLTISPLSHFSNHSMQARKWVFAVVVGDLVVVDLAVAVVLAVFVAAAMASLALTKCPSAS